MQSVGNALSNCQRLQHYGFAEDSHRSGRRAGDLHGNYYSDRAFWAEPGLSRERCDCLQFRPADRRDLYHDHGNHSEPEQWCGDHDADHQHDCACNDNNRAAAIAKCTICVLAANFRDCSAGSRRRRFAEKKIAVGNSVCSILLADDPSSWLQLEVEYHHHERYSRRNLPCDGFSDFRFGNAQCYRDAGSSIVVTRDYAPADNFW